jgi:hypothetical protein
VGYRFQNFNFLALPIEIITPILMLATTTSGYWKTYQSLVIVSHAMQVLVYDACLPYLPIMLHMKKHVNSFCLFLACNHSVVGHHICSLWFIPGVKAGVECTAGLNVLKTCTDITHLACRINLLDVLVCDSDSLVHRKLSHLTLVETMVPWGQLLNQPAAHQLFMQLTHLRVSGGTRFVKPDFGFASLSHLLFTCHNLSSLTSTSTSSSTSASFIPIPSAQFPVLQQIVLSIPYIYWWNEDPKTLYISGMLIDGRMDTLACPKKWKEADIWEGARHGENDLWTLAHHGQYQQKSPAFTSQPCTTGVDDCGWDSDEYGPFDGETGLLLEYGCTAGIGIAVPKSDTMLVTYTAARLCYRYISSYSMIAFLMCL